MKRLQMGRSFVRGSRPRRDRCVGREKVNAPDLFDDGLACVMRLLNQEQDTDVRAAHNDGDYDPTPSPSGRMHAVVDRCRLSKFVRLQRN